MAETDKKMEQPEDQLNAAPVDRTTTPDDPNVGPVGPPHWHALKDLERVLPAEVQIRPSGEEEEWVTVVSIKLVKPAKDKYGRLLPDYVLTTKDGDEIHGKEIFDPVLVRTIDTDASKLH